MLEEKRVRVWRRQRSSWRDGVKAALLVLGPEREEGKRHVLDRENCCDVVFGRVTCCKWAESVHMKCLGLTK